MRDRGVRTINSLMLSDHIVCESEYTKKLVLELTKGARPISVIGLPPAFINTINESNSLTQNGDYWLLPSHIARFKNQLVAIKAIKHLRDVCKISEKIVLTYPSFDIGYYLELLLYIKKNKLEKNIIFKYRATEKEMIKFYRGCKGVILTTRMGPTNMPAIEGVEFQKNVLFAKNSTNIADYYHPCEEFDPDDPIDLADKIIKFNSSETSVIEKFSLSKSFDKKWFELIKSTGSKILI